RSRRSARQGRAIAVSRDGGRTHVVPGICEACLFMVALQCHARAILLLHPQPTPLCPVEYGRRRSARARGGTPRAWSQRLSPAPRRSARATKPAEATMVAS